MAATVRLVLSFPAKVPNSLARELVEQWLRQVEDLDARAEVHWTLSAHRVTTPGLVLDVEANGALED